MRFGIRMLGITTILFGMYSTTLKDAHPQSAADSSTTPLILEKNEGEHRVRRPRETPVPTRPFTIKIDRKNGGSQKMFAGTEEIPAGGLIPRHKHLGQDEILLIQTGSAYPTFANVTTLFVLNREDAVVSLSRLLGQIVGILHCTRWNGASARSSVILVFGSGVG